MQSVFFEFFIKKGNEVTEHYIAYAGNHLSLAAMQERYISEFVVWANDITATEGTRMIPPMSFEEEIEWLRGLPARKKTENIFAVLVHEGTRDARKYRYIGHTGIHGMMWPDGVGVTGSILIDKQRWEKGYGTEAKLLLLNHAFNVCGLRKVSSTVKAFNARSLGHLIKCGYQIVGRKKAQSFHQGRFVDEILLEVFRDEWELVWEKYQETSSLPKLTDEQRALVTKETMK
jgi:RimJ/RimL family protein N-acetyltransferase